MEKEFILDSDKQARDVAQYILEISLIKKNNRATVFLLKGDLGAGKTTITKEVGKLLYVDSMIVSPTFVIMKNYKIQNPKIPYVNLCHIDAYRIKEEKEIEILRLHNIMENNDNIVFIEWPENLPNIDFSGSVSIKIEHLGDTKRKVIITS